MGYIKRKWRNCGSDCGPSKDSFRTLIGQFPEKNSNQGSSSYQGLSSNQGLNSNQGLSIQVNGVSAENYNLRLTNNEQGDIVVENLSKILTVLENKGYIIRW